MTVDVKVELMVLETLTYEGVLTVETAMFLDFNILFLRLLKATAQKAGVFRLLRKSKENAERR